MKKYILIILLTGMSLVLPTSCLKEYLDKAPESGLTDEQVFGKYDNFKLFFDAVYEGRQWFISNPSGWYDFNIKTAMPLYFDMWDQKYTWEGITDAADQGRYMEGHNFKSGSVSSFVSKFTYDGKRRPILSSMFTDIRICNMTLQNIHYLEESGVDPVEINDFKGQAHFIRAFCHFELMRIWGPMPYLTAVIKADDQWDIPRLSKHETLTKVAQDFDSAAYYFNLAGRTRRDNPVPGAPGNLASPDQRRPSGVAAKGYRARALLYAASPLNNEHGVTDWQEAAVANWEALQLALTNGYILLDSATMKTNFIGAAYTNEQLWAWNHGSQSWNSGNFQSIMPSMFVSTSNTFSGVMPTQNFVDRYETKQGEPLNSQADRDAAIAAGHYNDQNPYINRDARFYQDIIYNQSVTMPGWGSGATLGKAQIWYSVSGGVTTYSELQQFSTYLGVTRTGYYMRRYSNGNSSKSTGSFNVTDPLMRLAELYLNYAEAANEAYGPAGSAPGATLNAVQALNIVRARAKQPPVLSAYTGSTDALRPRIKNERCVEFAYEGHYYHDIRRWKDAPAAYSSTLIGMDIEKLPAGYDALIYPTGFRHTRKPLPSDRQVKWIEPMYYLPFENADNFKMKKFVPNVVW
jgi:hypothetical protein